MTKRNMIIYYIKSPLILDEINDFLNKKFEYGFTKGFDDSDVLCFFNNKEIFVQTYANGRIELSSKIDPLTLNHIKGKLKINGNLN